MHGECDDDATEGFSAAAIASRVVGETERGTVRAMVGGEPRLEERQR